MPDLKELREKAEAVALGAIMDDPWAQVGFLKEKLRQSETDLEVWKNRAFAARNASPRSAEQETVDLTATDARCPICDGGLYVCSDCGAAEIETEERVCTGLKGQGKLERAILEMHQEARLIRAAWDASIGIPGPWSSVEDMLKQRDYFDQRLRNRLSQIDAITREAVK